MLLVVIILPIDLSNMPLEKLWQLFPIYLTGHKLYWKNWYEDEKQNILKILPYGYIKRISHIGSTSIETIQAKPIIDILLETTNECKFNYIKKILVENDYICMSESIARMSFNKGYTACGFADKVFHLHLRRFGDNDELYFRDYLIENEDITKLYEKLKLNLWKRYENNRDAYTESKTEFVNYYTDKAKNVYGNKYGVKN